MPRPRICLVSASGQNAFFGEILEAFGAALLEHGAVVEESVDRFPPLADDLVYLFVAHEYHPLVREEAHPSDAQLRRSIALAAEQPGTTWFETAAETAARAGAVVDINPIGARELGRRGIPAAHAPLGYVPSWDLWRRREGQRRPIDMAFLGAHTDRRALALARCAPALSRRRCAIHLTETVTPHVEESSYFLTGDRRARLLARSKTLLNVHQQELAYLEWHRALAAILNGCVLISEHSLAIEPLEPGVHFVSADCDDLPHVLEGLLGDPELQTRIRDAAYDLVRDELPMERAVEALLGAADRAARHPAVEATAATAPPAPGPSTSVEGAAAPPRDRPRSRPARGSPAGEAWAPEAGMAVERLGATAASPPRVSVLLTIRDCAGLVRGALRSVALSDFPDVEAIVVDDGSSDGSSNAVRAACAELPWLPVRLVRLSPGGLPAVARNAALAHAAADLLLVLAAGDTLAARGLNRLTEALDDRPHAAFAYGIRQAVDVTGPIGLTSWLHWDPGRLRRGNFVGSMALVRRRALERVGGYPNDPALAGWEDFAVWVALARAGYDAVRLPDIVGSHRVGSDAPIALAGRGGQDVWTTLLSRDLESTSARSA